MSKRRVVVTGLGVISPIGLSTAETWEGIKTGKSGAGPITRFDCTAFDTTFACEVKGFDVERYLEKKEVKKHDLFSQYGMAAAAEAWADAKLEGHTMNKSRMGSIMGIGIGGLTTLEKFHQSYLENGPRRLSPFLIPAMIANLGPGNIAIKYGLKGVNYTITSACTSATHAIGESFRMISEGLQDVMITGGAEAAVTAIGIGGFCAMKALSSRNDAPDKASRPFDKDRDGFVLGEGAAILVLESLESAQARGAKIYAEMRGYGFSCDAYHITSPSEGGEGAVACMRAALDSAGMKPEEIAYINAHGTSTSANDSTETLAIKQAFGTHAHNGLQVSSTKSMTGHLLGAAGAIEAVFSVLAIHDGIVPPTINLDTPGEGCDLDYVPHKARFKPVPAVMSNSFGFGGTNASIVFSKLR